MVADRRTALPLAGRIFDSINDGGHFENLALYEPLRPPA